MKTLPRMLLGASLLVGGCGTIEKTIEQALHIEPRSPLRHLSVVAEVGANQDTATALEIVFVYDAKVAEALPKTAPEWFANRQALLDDLSQSMEAVAVGLPPASAYELPFPPHHHRAVRVYGYANYIPAQGQQVLDLTNFRCVLLRLQPQTVSRRPCL